MFVEFFLIAFATSAYVPPGEVVQLTQANWDAYVEQRSPDSVWMIMFSGDHCPACKVTYPIFRKAAAASDGMVNFGVVKSESDPALHMKFQIGVIPTFVLLHRGGRTDFTGARNERSMLNAAAKLIPDSSERITRDWAQCDRFVALFTDKEKTPPMWAAISNEFRGRVRVGTSSDDEVKNLFGVERSPEIVFKNETHTIVYNGRNSYGALRSAVADFVDGVYEEPIQFNTEFFLPEEYEDEIDGFNGFCVIHNSFDLHPKLKSAQLKFGGSRMKFFYGDENLPFDFIKKGDLYIISPHKNGAVKVSNVEELDRMISEVIDGNVNWTPLEELEK